MKIYDVVCPCGSHNFKQDGAETVCKDCGRKLTDDEISKLLTQSYKDSVVNKKIKVKCLNGFKLYKRNILYAEAIENKEYIAALYEESGEYFAKDDKGHEFIVGELDFNDNLKLNQDFKLIN